MAELQLALDDAYRWERSTPNQLWMTQPIGNGKVSGMAGNTHPMLGPNGLNRGLEPTNILGRQRDVAPLGRQGPGAGKANAPGRTGDQRPFTREPKIHGVTLAFGRGQSGRSGQEHDDG